jgi:hypothetical protein
MAETDVEIILREIRERVVSQQQAIANSAAPAIASGTNGSNGAPDSSAELQMTQGDSESVATDKLALINSYLAITARTWDRLPPLVSNRTGLAARLELWLKRRLRVGTRWFTWEQVNFNAAVHHAFRDMLPVLRAYEQELEGLRAEAETRRIELEQNNAELRTQMATERVASEARLADLASELRERDEQLQDEQRVLFKQLQDEQRVLFKQITLETSEAGVLEDRARRKTEALLEELQRRVDRLEKKADA